MAKVTIEDISRQTGLSRGTVSRALNDRPDISQQTKQRVLEACQKLNYSPSHAARSLATGRAFAVAVLVDNLQSTFAASFLRGVLARAQAARYAVHVAELSGDNEAQQAAVRALVSERIDCVLVAAPVPGENLGTLREALEDRPAVASTPIEGFDCDLLLPDETESGRLVARRIVGQGGRRCAYVHDGSLPFAEQRWNGFREICAQHGQDADAMRIDWPGHALLSNGRMDELAGRVRDIEAIAATDDFTANQLIPLLWRLGRIPGREVGLAGQGNECVGDRTIPTLTTTDFSGQEIGRRAMDLALARLNKTHMEPPETAHVAPRLIERDSTRNLS